MAGFGKTVTLEWQGDEYELLVTMPVIAKIEEDVNLIKLAQSLANNDVKMSHVAIVFAHLLREAGAKVTHDDVWQAMFSEDAPDVIGAATIALSCVFPEVKTTAPQESANVGKSKNIRGKKSTK